MMKEYATEFRKWRQIPVHTYYGEKVRFGVVSDTHIGSMFEHLDLLNLAYKTFRREGIQIVYHAGDMVDGFGIYPSQEFEQHALGFEAQTQAVIDGYPKFKNIQTYFITGNHDLSYWKKAGIDIGRIVTQRRPDLVYLGQEEADIQIKINGRKVTIRLSHPRTGTAYALSYQTQKYIDSLSGGQKPKILFFGHRHKAMFLPCYRNIFTLECG